MLLTKPCRSFFAPYTPDLHTHFPHISAPTSSANNNRTVTSHLSYNLRSLCKQKDCLAKFLHCTFHLLSAWVVFFALGCVNSKTLVIVIFSTYLTLQRAFSTIVWFLQSQIKNSQRLAGWVSFLIYKWRKCNLRMLSDLPKGYGTIETHSQVSWSSPKVSFNETVLCYLGGMIITEEIWQSWAARDGKKATQPSLVSVQIQLNIIRKRAIQFVHLSSLPALMLSWGLAQNCTDCDPGPSGPETPLCVRLPRRWRPAGGWSPKQMGKLINALGIAPAHPGTVRDSDSKVILQTPDYSVGPMCFPTPNTGAEQEGKVRIWGSKYDE